ncbi:hypothetical protein CWE09_01500 [Aliidiomarina minuta]|uniref:Secreted protein n=1 Tax=Aliidiomarina minuta TaxID=880057 RepID=A0A432W634_9GAMM|nr:hypothetical protein [Aliidiomarina minuta]RUO25439.1 hypothetical protein CWE09_01500 [Aliidiomarina minuta]
MYKKLAFAGLSLVFASSALAQVVKPAPLVSIASQDKFFEHIAEHCGKAYEGEVTVNNPAADGFEGPLIMHVRKCTEDRLEIPFHVGDNHSRTWILTKTGSGISLKHDHRYADGSYDEQTMYGGHTLDAGYERAQSFPVDQYSKEMFFEQGIPASNTNIWQMYIYPETFTYRLIREGREFRVDFDLTNEVELPPTPWGYQD